MYLYLLGPMVATVFAIVWAIMDGVPWPFIAIFAGLSILIALGVTAGNHRLFTHASYKTKKWVATLLGIWSHMGLQGSILWWCAVHFLHHEYSDEIGDPHTPYIYGKEHPPGWRGFWHAHFGWLLYNHPIPDNIVRRRLTDRNTEIGQVVYAVDRRAILWVTLSFLIPTLLGYVYMPSWRGAVLGLLWGGLVRMCFVQHTTWIVNSVCHMWGTQPFTTKDFSRDNELAAIVTLGEGYHNGHHKKPWLACHGLLRPWRDATYQFIRLLEKVGLAWDVRHPGRTIS